MVVPQANWVQLVPKEALRERVVRQASVELQELKGLAVSQASVVLLVLMEGWTLALVSLVRMAG